MPRLFSCASFIIGALIAIALTGCGDQAPPAKPPAPAPAAKPVATTPPIPTTLPATRPAASRPGIFGNPDDALRIGLAEIDALTDAADFGAALSRARDLQSLLTGHPRAGEIAQRLSFLRDARRAQGDTEFAIAQLGGPGAQTAEASLRETGRAGALLLAKTVVSGEEAMVAPAAKMLAELDGPLAFESIVRRVLRSPDAPSVADICRAAEPHAAALRPAQTAALMALIESDLTFKRKAIASLVAAGCDKVSARNAAEFDRVMGAGSHFRLHRYVARGLVAVNDPPLRLWALDQAVRIGVAQAGIDATYTDAQAAGKLIVNRTEDALTFPDPAGFKLPGNKLEHFNADYRAVLRVEKAGKYTIEASSDDGHIVWIDGNQLWGAAGQATTGPGSAAIDLTEGPHDLRVTYWQGPSGAALHVWWTGPGIERQAINKQYTRSYRPAATQPATQPAPTTQATQPAKNG